jgi:RNase P subunit RPR2
MNLTKVYFPDNILNMSLLCDNCVDELPDFFNPCEYRIDHESRTEYTRFTCSQCGGRNSGNKGASK